METREYICEYCRKYYVPKRRRAQKFCSTSCRVSSHKLNAKLNKEITAKSLASVTEKTKVDKMSFAGVGNSVAGTLAAEGLKTLFTKEENKPATKLDIQKLEKRFNRYQEIKNMPLNNLGQKAFFDSVLQTVVYRTIFF